MREREINYTTLKRDGRRVTIELWPNADAGLMLFYPGTMLSPIQYRPMLTALHEAGFAVAGLHLTGHGLNPHAVRFSFEDLLQDGLDAEEWLRNAGFARIAVCGHSQGGILTLAHAAASNRLTAAFPICGILPQRPEAIELTLFRALGSRRAALMARINLLARWLPRLPLPVPTYLSLRRVGANARRVSMSKHKSRLSYPLSYLASLFNARLSRHMQCPLFFFNARDDALFTPALARSTFKFLQAPQKKLIWLPGGGHLAALNPALCRYMARIAAAACAGLGLPLHLETPCPAKGANDGI